MTDEFDSRTQAKIEMNGVFTAADLEEAISTLMEARASLEPAVGLEPPSDLTSKRPVLGMQEPDIRFASLINDGLRIWIRHEGFGWIYADLHAETVAGIREFLSKSGGHSHQKH